MNPDLQAKLVTYLDSLEKGAAKVGEFAEREIPETIREWLLWLAIERFTYAAAFLVAAIVTAVIARRVAAIHRRWADEYVVKWPNSLVDYTGVYVSQAIGFTVAVLCLLGVGHWAIQGTKVIVAPRVVIVEKVAELAKGGGK